MSRPEKTLLIVNPSAGYNTGKKSFPSVLKALKESFDSIDYTLTHEPREAIELARNATDEGYELIIAMGGDGTAFEVVNGMLSSKKRKRPHLAFIPSGSGNSFLRDYGIESQEEAIERIVNGTPGKYDIIKYSFMGKDGEEESYFINIMGTGFVSRVAKMRLRYFRFFRSFGYTIGVLLQIIPLKKDNVTLVADGEKYELKNNFISLCNSKYTGGTMMMAPKADLRDGKMDIVMLNDAGRLELLRAFPEIFKGTHINNEKVMYLQAKKVSIDSPKPLSLLVDGEVIGTTPLKAEVLKHYLSILI